MTTGSAGSAEPRRGILASLFDAENPRRPKAWMRPHMIWSASGAFFAALLALGVSFGQYPAAATVAVFDLVLISGWPALAGLANRRSARILMALALLLSIPAALFGGGDYMAATAAIVVVAGFLVQMVRRQLDESERLIRELAAAHFGVLVILGASLWIVVARTGRMDLFTPEQPPAGAVAGLAMAICIAIAAIIHAVHAPAADTLGVVNAMLAGALMCYLLDSDPWVGLIAGAAVGLFYAIQRRATLRFGYPLPWVHSITTAVLPVCALGFVGFIFAGLLP